MMANCVVVTTMVVNDIESVTFCVSVALRQYTRASLSRFRVDCSLTIKMPVLHVT